MWIPPNNQYVVYLFFNKNLLQNISKANRDLSIFLTGGKTKTNLIGDLSGYGSNWFHPDGIHNIFYLSKVAEKYRVCYDHTNGNKFLVHMTRG